MRSPSFDLDFDIEGQLLSKNRVDFRNQRGLLDLYTKFGENPKLTVELCDDDDANFTDI